MTQPTVLEQIDLLLAAWDERLRRMDENLVALESEAIYQILAGKAGKRPALAGVTKERVSPALDAVTELFEDRERLAAVVTKAKDVRASISTLTFWDKDDKIAEIHRLLRGTSIELGQKVVALADRNLLDQSYHDVFIAPEQLLARMAERFQQARTVILAVSHAWEALEPEMAQIEEKMTRLRALAAELSPTQKGATTGEVSKDAAELAEAEVELVALRAKVAKDPLGAQGGFEQIKARLYALKSRLDRTAEARGRVLAGITHARDLYRGLREAHDRAIHAAEAARRDVAGAAVARLPPVLDDALLAGLEEWLHKLQGTVEARRWSPAEVGLTRWRDTAEQYAGVDVNASSAAEALLAQPSELSGRLSARRAQAAALAARGLALDPSFEAGAREAESLLHRRPVPLDDAAHAVEAYEAAVVALGARRHA